MTDASEPAADFIARWSASGGGEIANSQPFLVELCRLLDVPLPDPTQEDEAANRYVFEKAVAFNNGDGTTSQGRVDLYRVGCFVLESKQGSERRAEEEAQALAQVTKRRKRRTGTAARGTPAWDQAMTRARQQAKRYAEAIPDEWPPFLIVCDVGYCFDIYADFSQSGKNYVPFPDPQNYRLKLDRLADDDVRELLRTIWTDPFSLDPSRRAARVTRELAGSLAKLARSLESQAGHTPERVAAFLMRCLFTMFAEDIGLLPAQGFTQALVRIRDKPHLFAPMAGELWKTMNSGGFSNLLLEQLLRFNGGLFEESEALPLNADQLELLIEAGSADWREVEPAIFGTLLERALDPVERHKLGAHYTPRAYVERLVMPTLIEPLREQWETAYTAAVALDEDGDRVGAVRTIRQFHERLCETRVLDPACGSGNFLYVSLELMKRLEGEVLNALREFGETQLPLLTIDPHQFLGIEVNPRAAAITDLVLWIGYLQWHFRTRGQGTKPQEPVIRKFENIECRDAVLAWDRVEEVFDEAGQPVTRWDGRTTKKHPVTGEEVPDETARVTELRYINPRKAEWPTADYVVGNPPFVGHSRMREALGDGYTKAIRDVYSELPHSCDYVMFWWHNAATLARLGSLRRFGLIATNSLKQTFNRRVMIPHLKAKTPLCLAFAVPDHPWVDTSDGAAVRISMTVGTNISQIGKLFTLLSEKQQREQGATVEFRTSEGIILPDLTIGADVSSAVSLHANDNISNPGVKLHGAGFIVSNEDANALGYHRIDGLDKHMRKYRNGRDITQCPREALVIDLFGLSSDSVRERFPEVFQWVYERVKPERDHNNRASRRDNWWIFGEPNPKLRNQLAGLDRFITTVETSKHRFFVFLDSTVLPDNMLVNIALQDAYYLGVLSSNIHVTWALASGGTLEDRPRYNKTRCFETFPLPDTDEPTRQRIRDLGEHLDAHRKRQQELHPDLTMTGMYNVLEKLRAGEPLSTKEQTIHEQGLVSVLKELHDRLDEAVCDAYGWPHDVGDEEILQRLVDLNAERAAEEAKGLIRWLRPEFQNPGGAKPQATQRYLGITPAETEAAKAAAKVTAKKEPWPKSLPERIAAVRGVLNATSAPLDVETLAKHFTRARKADVAELLETLAALGHARQTEDGRFVG